MPRDRRTFRESFADRIPGVAALGRVFASIAKLRIGRVPVGLVALIPVALFIDLFDTGDELVGGPLGMGVSFLIESAFLLGLTGRAGYAIGLAGFDLLPIVDVVPWATITLVREISRAWGETDRDAPPPAHGPVIDV